MSNNHALFKRATMTPDTEFTYEQQVNKIRVRLSKYPDWEQELLYEVEELVDKCCETRLEQDFYLLYKKIAPRIDYRASYYAKKLKGFPILFTSKDGSKYSEAHAEFVSCYQFLYSGLEKSN